MLHDFSGTPTTRTEMLWKNRKNGQNPIQNPILHYNSVHIDRIGLNLASLDRTRRDEAAYSVLFFCDLPLQRNGRKIDFVIFRASLQRNYAFASGFLHCNKVNRPCRTFFSVFPTLANFILARYRNPVAFLLQFLTLALQ